MTLTATNATSYTDLQTFGRCPNKDRYRSVLRIQPKHKAQYFKVGILGHSFLMDHYLDPGSQIVSYEITRREIEESDDLFEEEKAKELESLETAYRVTQGYIEFYQDDWTILHVEETFIIMLENGEVVSFTPDLVVRDRNGFVWIIDHKFTNSTPKDGLPFSDLQALLYFAGVKALYPECKGFLFNHLRKKRPTQPRLNKTHNDESRQFGHYFVNNLKSIDTTYELLRDFLVNEAPALLDEPNHKARLAELIDNNRFYFREQLVITDEQADRVLKDVQAQIELRKVAHANGYFPRVYQKDGMQSCDGCGYKRICAAELLGWDADIVLQEHYEPRDDSHKFYDTEDDDNE